MIVGKASCGSNLLSFEWWSRIQILEVKSFTQREMEDWKRALKTFLFSLFLQGNLELVISSSWSLPQIERK